MYFHATARQEATYVHSTTYRFQYFLLHYYITITYQYEVVILTVQYYVL